MSVGEWLAIVFLVGIAAYFGGLLMGAALADGARADADSDRMLAELKGKKIMTGDDNGCLETVTELRAQLAQAQAAYPALEAWQRRAEQAERLAAELRAELRRVEAEYDAVVGAQLALIAPCAWTEGAEPGFWDSACGATFYLGAGATPAAAGWDFCPSCGHALVWQLEVPA